MVTQARPGVADAVDARCAAERLLAAARALRPLVEASAGQIERERRLPENIVAAMAEAGLLTMLVPRELGGAQVDPLTCLQTLEEVARYDGSTGWCLMVASTVGLSAGTLPRQAAHHIWGQPRAFVAGSIVGAGTARVTDGGYRVSGRWGFGSGCRNATHLLAMADVTVAGEARLDPNGQPEARIVYLPIQECQIVENWNVAGLLGTGSHDFAVDDAFVPDDSTLPRSFTATPWHHSALYLFGAATVPRTGSPRTSYAPWAGIASVSMAAVILGIAQGALDAFAELAATKTPFRRASRLQDDPVVQDRFGRADVRLRAARALLYQATADVWHGVQANGALGPDDQTTLRSVSAHAAETATEVVEAVWKMAGTTGIFSGNAIERRLRDAQVGAQNVGVSPTFFTGVGQLLLGRSVTS